jgi:hypothetical protein
MFCLSALCTFYINVGADCNPPFYIQLQIPFNKQKNKITKKQKHNKMRVSFDFDGTLTENIVQEYAKELVTKGIDVFIVTGRYNELLRVMNGSKTNEDLFALADEIGIEHKHIVFTNRADKSYTIGGSGLIWHLDDDLNALNDINRYSDVKGVWIGDSDWKERCNELLTEAGL